MPQRKLITLGQFIAEQERQVGHTSGAFSQLMRDIALAARVINLEVNRAGLADILGEAGLANVQGEDVKKLDVLANDQFINALTLGHQVCAIASEENADLVPAHPEGKYVVVMDPLDGSSNIDVNVSIGTIFAVYERLSALGTPATIADCLQPGHRQVAAGYVIYGTSTVLVYTTGNGVSGFTLDPGIGEFFLSHPNLRIPEKCAFYSLNDCEEQHFLPGIRAWLADVRARNCAEATAMKPRYIGSMVADFHRNLLKGGIFLYPGTVKKPNGKLRLLYEANPMAFIIEQAGGAATNGVQRILDLLPTELHQRTQIVMGSGPEVNRVREHCLAMANATTV